MATYGYCRISTAEQKNDRQLDAMARHGIHRTHVYVETASGKDTARPVLRALLAATRPGDTIVVESVSRFARNTKDLLLLVEKLSSRGVEFISQKENIDTATPAGRFMLTVFAAVAQLEREFILDRQREGIAAAKARGQHFGRPAKKPPRNILHAYKLKKISLNQALAATGLSRATFYRHLKNLKT